MFLHIVIVEKQFHVIMDISFYPSILPRQVERVLSCEKCNRNIMLF